jgi:drug/metabolite transporter (DMT)-like permease
MTPPEGRMVLPRLALWGAVAIWGINAHFVKVACLRLPPITFLAIRFAIATVTGLIVASLVRSPNRSSEPSPSTSIKSSTWWLSACFVAFTLGAFYFLQTSSLSRYSTVNAVFLSGTAVVWVPLIRVLIVRDATLPIDTILGITLCLLGFLTLQGFRLGSPHIGDLLALAGALFLAAEVVTLSVMSRRLTSAGLIGWTNTYSGLTALGLSVAWFLRGSPIRSEPATLSAPEYLRTWPAVVVALLFAGIVATGIAQLMANWSMGHVRPDGHPTISADQRALVESLDAPLTLAFGMLLFPWNVEPLDHHHLGFALLLAGVLTSELALATRLWRYVGTLALRTAI